MKVEFKVAMNAEEKALKNLHEVVINVEKCDDATMLKYALKAYVVDVQAQLRNNWDAFIKGEYPKEVVIGQRLFESKKGAPVTQENAKDVLLKAMEGMSTDQKMEFLVKAGLI